jgi:hypothetical protein
MMVAQLALTLAHTSQVTTTDRAAITSETELSPFLTMSTAKTASKPTGTLIPFTTLEFLTVQADSVLGASPSKEPHLLWQPGG